MNQKNSTGEMPLSIVIISILFSVLVYVLASDSDYETQSAQSQLEFWQVEAGKWESMYISNVCAGIWEDTEKLNPVCYGGEYEAQN